MTSDSSPYDEALELVHEAARLLLADGSKSDLLLLAVALDDIASLAREESHASVQLAMRTWRLSWSHVGRAFGISRQAATKRFGP